MAFTTWSATLALALIFAVGKSRAEEKLSWAPEPLPDGCKVIKCRQGYECREEGGEVGCFPIDRCICPLFYQPVCCLLPDGTTKTVGNGCECGCLKGKVISEGKCPEVCACPEIFDPVCCALPDGTTKTTSNKCECGCLKGKVLSKGECTKPCLCPALFKPVCCVTDDGPVTVSNECECKCKKGTVLFEDQCRQCRCADIGGPVCCKVNDIFYTAISACQCGCNGGTSQKSTSKCDKCDCDSDAFGFVCCRLHDGTLETLQSACKCECVGTVLGNSPCFAT